MSKAAALVLSLALILSLAAPMNIFAAGSAVNEVTSLIDGIVGYKKALENVSDTQELIDSALAKQIGSDAEWYVLSLRRYGGCDFSVYRRALEKYVAENEINNAVTRLKFALLLAATGYEGGYITETLENSTGKLGIMSLVFSLHLLNNGYTCRSHTVASVTERLLEKRLTDGGWAVTGEVSDVDVTCMALQALAPQYGVDKGVGSAVDEAVSLLASRRLDSGGFKSYGTENAESAAQVIAALSCLNIDCLRDGRFTENGSTLVDVLKEYLLSDGSFSHTKGGESNPNATVQALYSLVALYSYQTGSGSVFIFTPIKPFSQKPVESRSSQSSTSLNPGTPEPPAQTTAERIITTTTTTAITTTTNTTSTTAVTMQQSAGVQSEAAENTAQEPPASTTESEAASQSAPLTSENTAASQPAVDSESPNKREWKAIACAAVIAAAISLCLILYSRKKGGRLSFIIILAAAAVASILIFSTDIQSTDSYYRDGTTSPGEGAITVSLSIRCDTVAGKGDGIPPDGTVLEDTAYTVAAGSTAYDVLILAARSEGIHVENDAQTGNNYRAAYITGINYLYEFDFGDLSGWVFHVNGAPVSVGCGSCELSDGDKIEWLYTCDLGEDVK